MLKAYITALVAKKFLRVSVSAMSFYAVALALGLASFDRLRFLADASLNPQWILVSLVSLCILIDTALSKIAVKCFTLFSYSNYKELENIAALELFLTNGLKRLTYLSEVTFLTITWIMISAINYRLGIALTAVIALAVIAILCLRKFLKAVGYVPPPKAKTGLVLKENFQAAKREISELGLNNAFDKRVELFVHNRFNNKTDIFSDLFLVAFLVLLFFTGPMLDIKIDLITILLVMLIRQLIASMQQIWDMQADE